MKISNLQQGTPEWHAHRDNHYNASDAPVMMGESPYKTRQQLIHELATGIKPEVDARTQERFDDGHHFEALARPVAEQIVGEDLYPVVGSEDFGHNKPLSASYDGLVMMETESWEHKRLNAVLRKIMVPGCTGADLPIYHQIQMEQQCMVNKNLQRVLFMASEWDDEGNLIEERHCWYEPNMELRQRIIDGWRFLEQDVANYVPPEVKAAPETKAAEAMPVPSILVRGEVTMSNLPAITPEFDRILANINTDLVTDDHFAQADIDAKASREAAKNLKLTAQAVINQIAPVSEAVRTLEEYAGKFDAMGLKLEKLVASQKESLKTGAIMKAKESFAKHVEKLEAEIQPIRLGVAVPDFAGAIKGVKTIATMNERIGNALRAGMGDAEAVARDIRTKLAWYNEHAAEHKFLFNDLSSIIAKAADDFQLLVKTRISDHQVEQERKMEAERERIRLEEQARAEAAAQATLAAVSQESQPAVQEATKDLLTTGVAVLKHSVANDNVAVSHIPTAEVIDTGATLKLGDIAELLGFPLTAEFLKELGVEPVGNERRAVLYRAAHFPGICERLVANINAAKVDFLEAQQRKAA